MKFVSLGKNKVVNVAAIAQATFEDKGAQGVRLALTLISGVPLDYTGNDARTLWATLQEAASEHSLSK